MTLPFSLSTQGVGKLEGQTTTPKAEEDVDGALTNFASADNTDLFAAHVKTSQIVQHKVTVTGAVALQLYGQPPESLFIQAIQRLKDVQQYLESFSVIPTIPLYALNQWIATNTPLYGPDRIRLTIAKRETILISSVAENL